MSTSSGTAPRVNTGSLSSTASTTGGGTTPSTPMAAAVPTTPATPATPAPVISQAQREEDETLLAKEASLTPEQRGKRDDVRAQVIQEIQSTERSYVQSLDALSQAFVHGLKDKIAHAKSFQDISPVLAERLCSNLETLTNFHHSFSKELALVPTTAPGSSADPNADSIPGVFLRFSNFFKLYIPYLNGYEAALQTFNSLRTHKKFQEWLHGDLKANLAAHALKNGSSELDLLSYMIQPVQRVPRYVLLLKELKRQTSPHHPEFASLNDALVRVAHVASVINEGQRAVESANKLMSIQNRIVGEFESLIQPHRRLIREGRVTATYAHGMFATVRTRPSVFFLFSDILLWTSEAFKFKGLLDLTPAKLTPKSASAFVVDTANKMLQASFEKEEEAKSWFEAIDEVVCALQNEREKLRQRSRVQKARNLGTTIEKDAVHKLVTQQLLSLQTAAADATAAEPSTNGGSVNDGSVKSVRFDCGTVSGPPGSSAASGGTIGRATMGQRSGRKWEEVLENGEAKLRKEQEHLAAFSREKLDADTFAPPPEEGLQSLQIEGDGAEGQQRGEFASHASSSASPPAAASGTASATAPIVGGDRKFVARFVSRRGRNTLGKSDCLCTVILVHRDCPQHGEQAQQALLQPEA